MFEQPLTCVYTWPQARSWVGCAVGFLPGPRQPALKAAALRFPRSAGASGPLFSEQEGQCPAPDGSQHVLEGFRGVPQQPDHAAGSARWRHRCVGSENLGCQCVTAGGLLNGESHGPGAGPDGQRFLLSLLVWARVLPKSSSNAPRLLRQAAQLSEGLNSAWSQGTGRREALLCLGPLAKSRVSWGARGVGAMGEQGPSNARLGWGRSLSSLLPAVGTRRKAFGVIRFAFQ